MNQQQKLYADRVGNVPQSFIREVLKVASNPGIISFAGGLPNPSFFPVKKLEECAVAVFRQKGKQLLQYATTEGYYPLREFIANRYRQQDQLDISPEQILITNGSQQALDIVGKLFINPGDQVLLERPTYLGALQCFSVFQPDFKEVTLQEDGVDIDGLSTSLAENKIKLFYCIPNFQNPTGIRYAQKKRKEATSLLGNYDTIVVEDDPYGDICFSNEKLRPLYSYLPDQTILLGSFSKTIAPGLRVGWMVANEDIIRKAAILKQASDLHSGNLPQYILHEFLTKHKVQDHLFVIRQQYEKQKEIMMNCLDHYFSSSVHYTRPEGGMFTWLTLPGKITARKLLEKALLKNIIFVPGDSFYVSSPDTQTLRLNYSNVEETTMRKAMHTLGELFAG